MSEAAVAVAAPSADFPLKVSARSRRPRLGLFRALSTWPRFRVEADTLFATLKRKSCHSRSRRWPVFSKLLFSWQSCVCTLQKEKMPWFS